MKKRKVNAAATAVATTTQQVVDPYNSNVIDYHPLFHENNENININNNNATTETTRTIVGGVPNNGNTTIPTTIATTDPLMNTIMVQNHELRQHNIELVSIMKKQHGLIQFEVQQMKQMMYQFVSGDETYTALHQQQQQESDDESHYSIDDDDDDNGSHHSNITVIDYNTTPYEATLSKHPKDLFQLWREYQYGIDGRKAARKFNARERGNVRYVYHRRKIIWDKIKNMKTTNGGKYKTSHLAIIELYRKYGKYSTVTDIVNQLRIERQNKTSSEVAGTAQQQNAAGGGPQLQQVDQPVRANDDDDDDDDDDESHHNEATLSEKPKDLFQLWIEYQYGIDGRKAAKRFTSSERGNVKYKYHRRKVFWDKIKEMKRDGQYKTSYEAIQELYRIYGGNNNDNKKQANVTNIINQMRKDRRNKKSTPLEAAEAAQQTTIGVDEPNRQQQQPVRADDDDESHSSYDTINDDDTIPYEATLSELPKDLYQLWEEYEYGINGRKPAKLFNSRERGRVKYKYHRRKIVWDKIQDIMSNNIEEEMTHDEAIKEIYRIYGEKTISDITNLMRKDRMRDQKKKLSKLNAKKATVVAAAEDGVV